jgi:DNA-binding GntR family transcriptional regulator
MLNLGGRTPALRESLALLARDGIVKPLPQRGYLVNAISADEAKQVVGLRSSTLTIVAERLAAKELGNRLEGAKSLLSELSTTSGSSGEGARFLAFEGRLCSEYARLSTLFTAAQVIGSWSDQLRVYHVTDPLSPSAEADICNTHSQLLERVECRDSAGAIKVVNRLCTVWTSHIGVNSAAVTPTTERPEKVEKFELTGQYASAAF